MAVDVSFSLPIALLDMCLVTTGSQVLCQSPPQGHQPCEHEGSAAWSRATSPVLTTVSTSPPPPQHVLMKEWILNRNVDICMMMSTGCASILSHSPKVGFLAQAT